MTILCACVVLSLLITNDDPPGLGPSPLYVLHRRSCHTLQKKVVPYLASSRSIPGRCAEAWRGSKINIIGPALATVHFQPSTRHREDSTQLKGEVLPSVLAFVLIREAGDESASQNILQNHFWEASHWLTRPRLTNNRPRSLPRYKTATMVTKATIRPERTAIGGSLEIPRMLNGLWQLAGGHDQDVNIANASAAMDSL